MRHLVVVIPGIGGSVLSTAPPGQGGEIVWDAGMGDIAGLLFRPQRLHLDAQPLLYGAGLISTKKALRRWAVVRGYDGLWSRLVHFAGGDPVDDGTGGRVSGATVVAFAYDFRRSIVENAELLADEVGARLRNLCGSEDAQHKRVIVVAHSMGGLIARYWLGPLGGWPVCRALITLGTPHRGAPKALDWLANGPGKGWFRPGGPAETLRSWPSAYELLPRYPAIEDLRPGGSGGLLYPADLTGLFDGWPARAVAARGVHEAIEEGWNAMPRSGTSMHSIVGWSHATPRSATFDAKRVRVRPEVPDDPVFAGLAGDTGDKTVPALSAVPVELDLATGDRTDETHGQIIDSSSVLALLARYEGIPWGGPVRAGGDTVTAGLDLPDTVEAGREFTVGVHAARRSGAQGEVAEAVDLSDSTVWCELVVGVADGAGVALPAVPMRFDSGDGWCRCTLVAPPDGLHEVRITLQEVPGWSDIELTEPFMSHDDTLEEN